MLRSPTTHLLSGGLDEWFALTRAGSTQHYLTDALGSTVRLTDAQGAKLADYTYDPYGGSSNDTPALGDANAFQYTGRENDGVAGLYFYRARYYKPAWGRFISSDPIGSVLYQDMAVQSLAAKGLVSPELAASLYSPEPVYNHPYAYGFNNPLTYVDPEGLFPGGSGIGSPGSENPLMCVVGGDPGKCKLCARIKGAARVICLLWCLAEGKQPPAEPPPAPRSPPTPMPAPGPNPPPPRPPGPKPKNTLGAIIQSVFAKLGHGEVAINTPQIT